MTRLDPPMHIRRADPSDRDELYAINAETGDAGADARPLYRNVELLAEIWVGPYLEFEPELAFVVDNGERAVGYIIGTADTAAFVKRYRGEWLPSVASRWPLSSGTSLTDGLVRLLHDPERMLWPQIEPYPAHLHIDLLPSVQGKGLGRALMQRFLGALAARDVGAVHLGMVPTNVGARAFYDRLGFSEIAVPDPTTTYLGRATTPV